jgi:hypothetical protein
VEIGHLFKNLLKWVEVLTQKHKHSGIMSQFNFRVRRRGQKYSLSKKSVMFLKNSLIRVILSSCKGQIFIPYTETGYGLDDRGSGFDSQWVLAIILFTATSTSVLGPGCKADHSPSSSVEVKNAWRYTSTLQYVFMAWCWDKHRTTCRFKNDGYTTHT